MINALEGREQYQVCGQNCDPPVKMMFTPLFLKVNPSQQLRVLLTPLPIASLLSLSDLQ